MSNKQKLNHISTSPQRGNRILIEFFIIMVEKFNLYIFCFHNNKVFINKKHKMKFFCVVLQFNNPFCWLNRFAKKRNNDNRFKRITGERELTTR
jgi:hypothetical protein